MPIHFTQPHTCTQIDAPALEAWHRDGILKLTDLLPPSWLDAVRHRLRTILGADLEAPEALANLRPAALKPLGRDPDCVSAEVEPVKRALDALNGPNWRRSRAGGTWFCNAPTHPAPEQLSAPERLPQGLWHWDDRPDLNTRPGTWVFTPLTALPPHTGGTWLLAGSYQTVLDFYRDLPPDQRSQPTKKVKKQFAAAHPWFAALNNPSPLAAASLPSLSLMSVSGEPGDLIFMKDFTIHSRPAVIGPHPRICHTITTAPTTE